jgi:hypothetical protein
MKMHPKLKSEANLWSNWWSKETLLAKVTPLLIAIAYILFNYLFHILRTDHLQIAVLALALWYTGPRVRPLFKFLLPLLLVGVVYDSQRIYADYIRGPIHVREPYEFDKYFFGINTPDGRLTPNEWWQKHTLPILDLYTGFFYLAFISIYVFFSMYLCFFVPRKGTAKRTKDWFLDKGYRPMWAFFFVNVLGYSTYYWFAAAPPWYVAAYGLGPADLTVKASAAGALRFDALLGTHFFTGMYGRAADVFGAIPSLHVAYPLQSVYYAFRYGTGRTFAIFFYCSMCFSAVYLNHHYILDILWGSTYAILVCVTLDVIAKRRLASLTAGK